MGTLRSAFANPTAAGNTAVVPGVAGKRLTVYAMSVNAAQGTTVNFQSNATPICGNISLAANGGSNLPYSPVPWFSTNPGEALNINLSLAVNAGVSVLYDVES